MAQCKTIVSSFRMRSRFALDPVRMRALVFLFLALFAGVGWLYVIFLSDALTIRDIKLEEGTGLDPISAKGVVMQGLDTRKSWRPWSPRHIWFINEQELATRLKEQWFAEDVQISHQPWERILRLKVQERVNRLVVHSKQQFLWIDVRGFVTQELTLEERQMILERLQGRRQATKSDPVIIDDNLQELVAPGYRVSDIETVKTWLQIDSLLKTRQLAYRNLIIPDEPGATSLKVVMKDGVETYVDTLENVLGQINALDAYLEYAGSHQKQEAGLKPSEYIDVRIPGRIYVK